VRCIRSRAGHFAAELHKSMKGLGTDDDTLCRVLVSRASVDMVQIKAEFQKMYKQTLGMFVAVSQRRFYFFMPPTLLGRGYRFALVSMYVA